MLDDTRLFNLVHLKKKYTYQLWYNNFMVNISLSNGCLDISRLVCSPFVMSLISLKANKCGMSLQAQVDSTDVVKQIGFHLSFGSFFILEEMADQGDQAPFCFHLNIVYKYFQLFHLQNQHRHFHETVILSFNMYVWSNLQMIATKLRWKTRDISKEVVGGSTLTFLAFLMNDRHQKSCYGMLMAHTQLGMSEEIWDVILALVEQRSSRVAQQLQNQ